VTTSATQVLPTAHVTADDQAASDRILTNEALHQVECLTEELFFDQKGLHRRSILMVDLGGSRTSSLWLATGMAAALGRTLRQRVHVLSVGSRPADILSAWDNTKSKASSNYALEPVGEKGSGRYSSKELSDRVPALRADGGCVIIHVSQLKEPIGVLARTIPVDGIVLLIRAGKTRRAVIEAIARQLPSAGKPLLGSVLLDRTYPIPEKLYRLL
jgi:hypothetical protein